MGQYIPAEAGEFHGGPTTPEAIGSNGWPSGAMEEPIKANPLSLARDGRVFHRTDPMRPFRGSLHGAVPNPFNRIVEDPDSPYFDITTQPPRGKNVVGLDDLNPGNLIKVIKDKKVVGLDGQVIEDTASHRAMVLDVRKSKAELSAGHLDVLSIEPGENFGVAATLSALQVGLEPSRFGNKELGAKSAWSRFTRVEKITTDLSEKMGGSLPYKTFSPQEAGEIKWMLEDITQAQEEAQRRAVERGEEFVIPERGTDSYALGALVNYSIYQQHAAGFQRDLAQQA